jgi:DNA (cytosine-5)-methyltransferase 1
MRFIDLFCGIGGFHQALKNFNFQCVFASDIDENCRETYFKNYGLKPFGDILEVKISEIPDFDILCAGFPCQPFSKAGFQKGFDDDRGNLFFRICKIVKHHRPKYLILENVRNLASHDNGNTWNVIKESIKNLGYLTYEEPVILNTLHFDVPQNRERVIIMCKRNDLGDLPVLPEISKSRKCKENLSKFLCDQNENKISGKLKVVEKVWDEFIKTLLHNNIEIPKFPIWTDWWDGNGGCAMQKDKKEFYLKYKNWIDKNKLFYKTNKKVLKPWLEKSRLNKDWFGAVRKFEWQAGDLLPDDGMDKVLWTARGSGIRAKRPNYIPTLVAMSQIPVYGPESRKLTARELLRLQSFPDSFDFDKKNIYKQLGNSVNVKMIEKCVSFLVFENKLF